MSKDNPFNPRGWSERYAAALARKEGDPERARNNAIRHATIRRGEVLRLYQAGQMSQDVYDVAMAEIDDILTAPDAPVIPLKRAEVVEEAPESDDTVSIDEPEIETTKKKGK